MRCGLCSGSGHRVIATISDPHWATDRDGRPTLTRGFARLMMGAVAAMVTVLCLLALFLL
jgi:hypothetical protein